MNQLERKFWIYSRPVFHHHLLLPDPTCDAYVVGFAFYVFWSFLHFLFSFCYDSFSFLLYYLTFSILLWKRWLFMCLFMIYAISLFINAKGGESYVLIYVLIYVLWYVCCDMQWIYEYLAILQLMLMQETLVICKYFYNLCRTYVEENKNTWLITFYLL